MSRHGTLKTVIIITTYMYINLIENTVIRKLTPSVK